MKRARRTVPAAQTAREKPLLRGVFHLWAFAAALPVGIVLIVFTSRGRGRMAAAVFAVSVVAMFGASALYHRPTWTPRWRARLRRLDHAGIYARSRVPTPPSVC
jgi:hemolysin III